MEKTDFYKGIDNVTIHAVEHDIVFTEDITFDYLRTGKKKPRPETELLNRLNLMSLIIVKRAHIVYKHTMLVPAVKISSG